MSTIEQQAYEILNQSKYTLNISGQDISFRYATLNDLQKISAIASKLPILNEIDKSEDNNADIPQVVDAFKYAKDLGDIIMVTAEINVELDKSKVKRTLLKSKDEVYEERLKELYDAEKRRIENIIYNQASTINIWVAVQQILKNNHVFFYQNTITFLKGMNQMKPTKETDQTVRGQ